MSCVKILFIGQPSLSGINYYDVFPIFIITNSFYKAAIIRDAGQELKVEKWITVSLLYITLTRKREKFLGPVERMAHG